MSFLDTNGLTYFYSKLKEKFIRSVNSITPDTNGNVVISNVDTANNLTSPDAQASYGEFIYRTSGGTASLTSGEAQIAYVDGNVRIDGRIPESFQFTGQNGIIVSEYSADIWRSEIDTTGAYNFSYTKPTSISPTSDWSPQIGTWSYNGSQVNLSSYGLTVVNIIAPSLSITANSSSINDIDITPNTWMSQISESGDYTFAYSETNGNWYYNGTIITLNTYGINIHSSIPTDGDEIYISYNVGTPNSILTVNYTAADQGTIVVATPTAFKATGFNQFNGSTLVSDINDTGIINNASISNGVIVNTSGRYICYVHAVGGVERGYVAYSESGTIRNIGWCENLPQLNESVVTTDSSVTNTISSILFANDGYVVVEVTSYNDLCVHPRWSTDDETYEAYVLPSVKEFPTEDIEGTPLPIGIYGMPSVGTVADRLDFDTGVYIKRIERIENNSQNMTYVQGLEVSYDWDSNYIYYVRPTPQNYIVDVNPVYTVNDFGTEEFVDTEVPLKVQLLYGQNLRDKLRTDVVTISAQSLSANQKAQVCTNIGAVNKTGDIMSGDLFISGASAIVLDSRITSGTAPSSDIYGRSFYLNDSQRFNIGTWQLMSLANGREGFQLVASKKVNNVNKFNYVRMLVDANGDPVVDLNGPAAWRTALNAVNKAGDTMTGNLIISKDSPMIAPKNTTMVATSATYSSSYSSSGLLFMDKNGQYVGQYSDRYETDGSTGILMGGAKRVNNANVWNFLRLLVKPDGTRVVAISDQLAWRGALGLAATAFTPTRSTTNTDGGAAYGIYDPGAKTVRIYGRAQKTGGIPLSSQMFSVPSAYRPSATKNGLCFANYSSGFGTGGIEVKANGDITQTFSASSTPLVFFIEYTL